MAQNKAACLMGGCFSPRSSGVANTIRAAVAMSNPTHPQRPGVSPSAMVAVIAVNKGAKPRITGNTSDKSPRCSARIIAN